MTGRQKYTLTSFLCQNALKILKITESNTSYPLSLLRHSSLSHTEMHTRSPEFHPGILSYCIRLAALEAVKLWW